MRAKYVGFWFVCGVRLLKMASSPYIVKSWIVYVLWFSQMLLFSWIPQNQFPSHKNCSFAVQSCIQTLKAIYYCDVAVPSLTCRSLLEIGYWWLLMFDRFTVKEKTSEAWWRDPRSYPPLLVSNFVILCVRWWKSLCETEDQSYTRVFNPQTARCLWFL